MAYVNTGYQRSLTVVVTKRVNGAVTGSTTYDGRLAFGSYTAITSTQLAQMGQAAYNRRLLDFQAYVEAQVPGLRFSDYNASSGYNPYIQNTSACPVGQ